MKEITKYEAKNAVISYYVGFGADGPSNLEMTDDGESTMIEESNDDDDEDDDDCQMMKLFRLAKIAVPALLLICICVALGCCLRKCKNKKPTDKYSEMYEEQDTIEAGL